MMRFEEAIRLDVIDQLKWDSRVDISDLDVESRSQAAPSN